MSNNVKIVLNRDAISSQLLSSPEIEALMEQKAREITSRCDGSYNIGSYKGKRRSNISISSADAETYHKNLNNNELLKALRR